MTRLHTLLDRATYVSDCVSRTSELRHKSEHILYRRPQYKVCCAIS